MTMPQPSPSQRVLTLISSPSRAGGIFEHELVCSHVQVVVLLVRPAPLIGENPVCALFLSTSLRMPHTCVGGVVPKA